MVCCQIISSHCCHGTLVAKPHVQAITKRTPQISHTGEGREGIIQLGGSAFGLSDLFFSFLA